jgi:hypothetical protein
MGAGIEMFHGQQRSRCRRNPGHDPAAPPARPSGRWPPLCRPRPPASMPSHRPSGVTSAAGLDTLWSLRPFPSRCLDPPSPAATAGVCNVAHCPGQSLQQPNRTWLNNACRRRTGPGSSQERAGRPLGHPRFPNAGMGQSSQLFSYRPGSPLCFCHQASVLPRGGRDWSRPGASLRRPLGDRGKVARVRVC